MSGAEQHGAAGEEEEETSLRAELRERVIRLEGMDVGLKLPLLTTVALLLAGAVLIGFRNAHLPGIVGDDSDGVLSTVPDVVLVLCLAGFAAAWAFLLAATFRAGLALRLVVLAVFGWALSDARGVVTGTTTAVTAVVCALLGAIVVLAVVTYLGERPVLAASDRPAAEAAQRPFWRRLRHLSAPLLFLLIAGALLAAWLGEVHVGDQPYFTTTFSLVLSNHQFVLIPLLVLAGADFGEWGSFAAGHAVRCLGGYRQWLLVVVALVVCAAVLADGIRISVSSTVASYGGDLQTELVLGGGVVLTAVLLLFAARPSDGWPERVPFAAVGAVAVVDSVAGFVSETVLNQSDPDLGAKIYAVSAITWSIAGALCLAVMLVRRGRLASAYVAAGTFVVLVGITQVLQALPAVGLVVHPFGLNFDNAPYMGPEGIKAVLAGVGVALVLVALATRRLARLSRPIALVLVAVASLQILTWVDSLFGATLNETEKTSVLAGIVIVIAIAWELTTSGDAVTNADTRHLARPTRLLLYLGYVLLVTVSVVYYGDLHSLKGGELMEAQFDSEEWVRGGVLFLGIPLVLATCVARLDRWRATLRPPATASGASARDVTSQPRRVGTSEPAR